MDLLSLSFAGVTPHEYKMLTSHGHMGVGDRIREKVSWQEEWIEEVDRVAQSEGDRPHHPG